MSEVEAWQKEFEEWKVGRLQRLTAPDGWLTVCGLFYLEQPDTKYFVGSAESNHVKLPKSAADIVGYFTWNDQGIRFKGHKGATITVDGKNLQDEEEVIVVGEPKSTLIQTGDITFFIIKRDQKWAVRVRDKNSPLRVNFEGIQYFPFNPKWRVVSTFHPYNPPKMLPVKNVKGHDAPEEATGYLEWEVDGAKYTLDAIDEGEKLYIIFKDKTNGQETYGMRYMYVPKADKDNKVVLDFNRAFNPPCAYTQFATCPIPHQQNRLQVRVEAGELNPHDSDH